MALTRLDNLISSKTGKYLYVSPDDFNASDELNNRGNSPVRPFKSIQRAFIEIARYSYLPGADNDRFDQFTIMLMPGIHYIDNRPGLVDANSIPEFGFDQALSEWTDTSNLDISDPDNILYKFNNTEGGAIIPRGSSMVGYDLRRTALHPLYVPDPADRLEKRSAIFNVTGGCYFWQMTIRDGDLEPSSPLYEDGVGKVYYQNGNWDAKAVPNFSHHKLTVFEYADKEELGLYYQKVAKAFSQYQPTIDDEGEFGDRIQETRIVGPLSDIRSIESIKCTDLSGSDVGFLEVEVSTKVNHGYFKNQFIAIENNGLDDELDGTFAINEIDGTDLRKFTYRIKGSVAGTLGLINGQVYTTTTAGNDKLSPNAAVKAEVDSVESASPYVFNCSIRSTWGICGIWANGLKATGFKSMVIAQYTGVSLQKDDRAFIRYDEYTNTFNQASLSDAFATVPYHTKGDAFWKDDWRNFHVRASEDAFIQCVSIFAVGFADHFLMESGGDMSITNSNSNFGNTSLHAIGHKGYAFNQDKGGYITDIVPPEQVVETEGNTKKNAYYTLDVQASNDPSNHDKIYIGDDSAYNPSKRPAASIDGYRIGAKEDDKLFVKLTPRAAGQDNIFSATLTPSGFKRFVAAPTILNPGSATVNNANLDAANRIEDNKEFIAHEAYGYITSKYPNLLVTESIDILKCRRDIGYLIDATVQDLRLGGNINTIQAAESYYVGNELSYITKELTETLEGYYYARDLAIAAARNFSYLRQNVSTTSGSSIVNVGDTSGIVPGMTVLDYEPTSFTNGYLNNSATRPASPAIPNNTFVKRVIDTSTIELGQKATYSEKKTVSDRHGDVANLIEANKSFIAAEAYDRMIYDYPGYTGATADPPSKCKDDLERALTAIANDVAFGGNEKTWDAAHYYDAGEVLHIGTTRNETIRAYEYLRDMAVQVMRKEDVFVYGSHGLTQVKTTSGLANPIADPQLSPIPEDDIDVVSDKGGDALKLITANKNLIAHEAVERMVVQSSTQTFTPIAGTTYDPATGILNLNLPNHGLTAASAFTASNAQYDPTTGVLTLTAAGQNLVNGEKIQIVDESLWLKCSMDGQSSVKKYPRASDPVSGKWLEIYDVVGNNFKVNVGATPLVTFTPSAATYDPNTGLMTLTIGNHGLKAGTSIKLAPESLKFSCGFGGATGTSAEKSYPRATDPFYDTAINIESATADTITLQVLATQPSTNVDAHTFVSATAGAVIAGGNYTHVVDQIAPNGIKRANDSIRIDYDALTFTCGMDNDATQHKYPRVSDPAASSVLPVTAVSGDFVAVNIGKTPNVTYDVSDASYNQVNGDLVLTINDHNLVKGSSIRLADGSLEFKCSKDSYATTHAYPRSTDPAYQTGLEIKDVGSSFHTPTSATYDPATGILGLTVPSHGFVNGNMVKIANDSLTFKCAMDGGATEHAYPRTSDPKSNTWIEVSNVTADTFEVNVGAAGSNQLFTAGSATTYDPVSGDLVLDIGSHSLTVGDGITIDNDSLSFTCTMDGNQEAQTYPRAGKDQAAARSLPITTKTDTTITVNVGGAGTNKYFQPSAATYNQSTGDMTVTIGQHGLSVGSDITLKDNSIKFTCDRDNHQTEHSYPRPGTDPKAGKSIAITSVGSTSKTATNAVYSPSNGTLVITSSNHGFANGDYIKIQNNSLVFSCELDGDVSSKSYPRPGFDYPSGRWLKVSNSTADTFTVNVGLSSNTSIHSFVSATANGISHQDGTITFNVGQSDITNYTPGNATTYDPTTGLLVLDIGTHSLNTGERIKIADGAIKFKCDEDSKATEHAYPRATDPVSGKSLNIQATTSTTITVQVLDVIPSTNVTAHEFVANSGVANSITAGDDYAHTFVSAVPDAVEYEPESTHTFVNAVTNSIKHQPQNAHTFVRAANNGIQKQNGTITINVGAAAPAEQYSHDFVGTSGTGAVISGGNYTHTWVSSVADSVHKTFSVGGSNSYHNQDCVDDVVDLLEAIAHNVAYGGNDKTWDAAYSYKTGNHVAGVSKTVTAANYTPADGNLQLTIGAHTNEVGDRVKIPQGALIFTCAKDGNATTHTYPRATDPIASYDPAITSVTATTITINVGPANDNTAGAHTFVSASQQIQVGGEGTETNIVFEYAKEMAAQVTRRQKILCIGNHGLTQDYNPDGAITEDSPSSVGGNKGGDARNLLESNKDFIAREAYSRMILQHPNFLPPTGNSEDCIDDIKDFITEIAYNVAFGGNDRTWDMANLYVTGAHVAGEEEQTLMAFEDAREMMVQVARQEKVLVIGSHGRTQTYDATLSGDADVPLDNRVADAKNLIVANTNFIAEIALGRMIDQYPSYAWGSGYSSADCLDDLKDVVGVVAHNMAHGGNDRVWDAANMYVSGAHASGSENETIYSFNQVRDIIHEVMTNVDVNVNSHTSLTQVKDTSITNGVADGRCDNAKSSVTSLVQILTATIASPTSLHSVTRTQSVTRCEGVRSNINTLVDIVIAAINNPNSLAAVSRTRSAGNCEDIRSTIDTLFNIVQNTVTTSTSLNNVTRTLSNGRCQNVVASITTLFDIVTNTISNPNFLQSIEKNATPMGLAFGPSVTSLATTSNSYLYFTLPSGVYTSIAPVDDPSHNNTPTLQDTNYPKCVDQAHAIRQYFANIGTIIQSGLDSVNKTEPPTASSDLASRATVWITKDPTTLTNNPHNFETGTPVRLVPRPKAGVTVDKRNVRLPNGFSPNQKYYVIAPGRITKPAQYQTNGFTTSDQSKLMLASSKENAAAGIYLHSAEVEGIHPDVEIDIYQFVLDDKYDLHEYGCTTLSSPTGGIKTDVPHVFDIPTSNTSGHEVFFKKAEGGSLPTLSISSAADPDITYNSRLKENRTYWARYVDKNTFTIHKEKAHAINGTNEITFQNSGDTGFIVYCNKRESPMRYDALYPNPDTGNPPIYGKWYLQVTNQSENPSTPGHDFAILTRLHEASYNDLSGIEKTNDSWFERIKDDRDPDDRIYRLRYVIPEYLSTVRDPLNGFSIKVRKDTTRKLLPQKIVLKPVVSGAPSKAVFYNPAQPDEWIGATESELKAITGYDPSLTYDPFRKPLSDQGPQVFTKSLTTKNKVDFNVLSGRSIIDGVSGDEHLELTVYDPSLTSTTALINETFTTVKISVPQGGTFTANPDFSIDNPSDAGYNKIEWYGNCSGFGFIHAALNVPGTDQWHLILKGVNRSNVEDKEAIDYDPLNNTRFTHRPAGTSTDVFADLLADKDYGKSLQIKDLIRKNFPEYYYRQNGAKVYTLTPGDVITAQNNSTDYYIASVQDVGEIDDTFYIFDVEEVQKRIFKQQEGIYYLTAVRGNISPYPTGAGNQGNFRNFKFSQPISKLYPLNYKNDPLWFKSPSLHPTEIDPPATYSAADNYVHGLVTVNDFKGSITRESIGDFLHTSALALNTYTDQTGSGGPDNRLRAQKGNAASGSEDRLIPISGDNTVAADQRFYVELRRPSIARAGNHTFEYLGFGPGNYSTGLPIRQEVLLTPIQDFYSQSKKQDGGLVFYTGLNSNGDLYIGNRKIDAITGEEEFLESAKLIDSDDDTEDIGGLVTTFDTPVTFNEYITVNGGDNQDKTSTFNSPVTINVLGRVRDYALRVISNTSPNDGDDGSLDTTQQYLNQDTNGQIVIARNRIAASVFQFNPRGSAGAAQGYKIQNHVVNNLGSNISPNQDVLISAGGTAINVEQAVQYGNAGSPLSGDMLLKGNDVGKSGSLGWIYANFFRPITANQIKRFVFDGTSIVKIEWEGLDNFSLKIQSGSQIKIAGYSDSALNGTWPVIANGFDPANDHCHISIIENRANIQNQNPRDWSAEGSATMEAANAAWKEFGVLGSETIRTQTEWKGDFRLGINTISRADHAAYANGFVHDNGPAIGVNPDTQPRANLDVVGTTFISGKTLVKYDANGSVTNNNYLSGTNFTTWERAFFEEDNALLVGGDAYSPDNEAVMRVATTGGGRLGVNTLASSVVLTGQYTGLPDPRLNENLTVIGTGRFSDDVRFQQDIDIDGGGGANTAEVRTQITEGTFEFLMTPSFTGTLTGGVAGFKALGDARNIEIGNVTGFVQHIKVGNTSYDSHISIGATPDNYFLNSALTLGVSKIVIGGAYDNTESQSFTRVGSKSFIADGDVWIGNRRTQDDFVNLYSPAGTVSFFSNSGGPNKIDFGLNASEINIAGQGGLTTINNRLQVNASAKFLSDIWLCGGTSSFQFAGNRAQMGTALPALKWENGLTSPYTETNPNKNVDILNVIVKLSTEQGYNQVDAWGDANWGHSYFQNAQTNVGGTQQPQNLPALSGDEFYLPLKVVPLVNDSNGNLTQQYFAVGDYILIDTGISGTDIYPEIVQITELTRTTEAPYVIKVKRKPFGSFQGPTPHVAGVFKENHPDETPIYKVNVQFDATWTEQDLDNTGPQDDVYLAEFGGKLIENVDYIIVGRKDTQLNGDYDLGEIIKVIEEKGAVNQKLKVSNCGDPDETVFEVDSVTGGVIIGNPNIPGSVVEINTTLKLKGGCGTIKKEEITGSIVQDPTTGQTNYITNISAADIAKIQVGDVITGNAQQYQSYQLVELATNYVTEVRADSIKVLNPYGGFNLINIGFFVSQNETLTLTNGKGQEVFDVDSCTGVATIGNHFRRMELVEFYSDGVGLANVVQTPAQTIATHASEIDNIIVHSYWHDPVTLNQGARTTIRDTVVAHSSYDYEIPVQGTGSGTNGQFEVGDLLIVGPTALINSAPDPGLTTILVIRSITTGATPALICDGGQEGTTVPAVGDFSINDEILRIKKHKQSSKLVDIAVQQRGSNDYTSCILETGYIVQSRIDYPNFLRFENLNTGINHHFEVISNLAGTVHDEVTNHNYQSGSLGYGKGDLKIGGDLNMIGGNVTIFDSVNQSKLVNFINDQGHADHLGVMEIDAGITVKGTLLMYPNSCPEMVFQSTGHCDPSFEVDNVGNVTAGLTLNVTGVPATVPSETSDILSIRNLGINGADKFAIKHSGAIESFGIDPYWTKTGGVHTRYVSNGSTAAEKILTPNIQYLVSVTIEDVLVLTLPENPTTGDVVRVVDVSGNLDYRTSLVVRAPGTNVKVQGDATGTTLQEGTGFLAAPYPSGELVVQTPNAGFALIYLGGVDSAGRVGIPTTEQGWWLVEV